MTEEERRKIEDTIGDAKANYKEKETLLVKKELIFILYKLYNQYNNLEEINKSHQEENGKLRVDYMKLHERNNDLERALVDDEYRKFLLDKEKQKYE